MIKEELVDKLKFEDRIEYKLESFRSANSYNFSSIMNYVFVCSCLIIGAITDIIFLTLIFGFIVYLIARKIDSVRYNNSMNKLNSKYFLVKPREKKKK